MRDHQSWRITIFRHKELVQHSFTCHQRPPVFRDHIFLAEKGVLSRQTPMCQFCLLFTIYIWSILLFTQELLVRPLTANPVSCILRCKLPLVCPGVFRISSSNFPNLTFSPGTRWTSALASLSFEIRLLQLGIRFLISPVPVMWSAWTWVLAENR